MARITIEGSTVRTHTEAIDIANGVQTLTKIEQLSDVDLPVSLETGQILVWNGSTMNWENGNTVDNDLTVTGNMIPYTLRANADTGNAFAFTTTWENYGVTDYDITTTLVTYKDLGADQLALHQWRTENGNPWYRFTALDTGNGDDGSHISRLTFQGDGGEITTTGGSLRLSTDSVIVSNEIVPNILRANADTNNAFAFTTTWENYGTTDYDVTTRFVQFADPGNNELVVQRWQTPESYNFISVSVNDTGNGDDGSHISKLELQGGGGGEITTNGDLLRVYNNNGPLRLLTDSGDTQIQLDSFISLTANNNNIEFNTGGDFSVNQSNNIEFNADNNFTVNSGGPFNVYSGGSQLYMENGYGSNIRMTQQLEMVLREPASNLATGVQIIRHNSDDGGNVNNSTNVQYNFRIKSEDETVDNIVGTISANYNDGGNGNRFALLLNDASDTEVNSVILRETYTTTTQPFAYPNFTQTEINAMSPSNGWVLYNSDTAKLQVYSGGSWVDLH